jgi:hypothetical protein
VATMAPATAVTEGGIFGVTDHGVLVGNHPYRLVPYGASTGPAILSTVNNFTPQIVGSTIAWVDSRDRLLVADAADL